MRKRLLFVTAPVLLCGGLLWFAANEAPASYPLPYAEAGLTEREAAVHLLSRFTFGPRPGDVDRVVATGLEAWLDRQLHADLPDRMLDRMLEALPALGLTATQMAQTYPNPGMVLRQAIQEGDLTQEDVQNLSPQERRRQVRAFMDANALKPQRELVGQLIGQKVLRARYGENQLREVLTDFWFNHFNVSIQDNQARPYVLSYERDAIRPHVLGSFRALLGATAKHPAMLLYLDNALSTAPEGVRTTLDARLEPAQKRSGLGGWLARRRIRAGRERLQRAQDAALREIPEGLRPRRGINENYARELLELHTLGVDGGYTQPDVEAVARALTGWTVVPPNERAERLLRRMKRGGARAGFTLDGAFLFRADVHDATAKTMLGASLPADGGLDEGERVLDLVAAHPSTARHLARKLAVRFVSDDPPAGLVDRLAGVFLASDGDLRAVMRSLAYAPHFWKDDARRAKVKSPVELAVSSLRALDAEVHPTRELVAWIDRMGQPLYRYQAPTGFPDAADHWINAGTLLNRINFGLDLAAGRIDGVRIDLPALADGREPESFEEALATYAPLLLPEAPTDETVEVLLPMAADPTLDAALPPSTLARIVGVLLGAPAFQRR